MHAVPIWHSVPIAGEHSGQAVLTRQGDPGLHLAEDAHCAAHQHPEALPGCPGHTRLLRLTRQRLFRRRSYCAHLRLNVTKGEP
jgi:hypothetical protein